jgi:RHS repeat-associated protein
MPKDVLAYEVLYYPGDYRPIGGYQGMSNFRDFAGLYNGNIGMTYIHQDTLSLLARQYRYDALQRLRQVRVREGIDLTPIPAYQEHFTYDKDGNITSVLRYGREGVMDSLRYHYYSSLRNWLSHVTDTVRASAYQDDLDSQPAGNYRYDPVGNLIEDVSEGVRIRWTHYGKISRIDSADTVKLRFQYDALGNRVVKEYVPARRREVYVRDVQGTVLSSNEVRGESLFTKVFYMYGHQRLGYLVDERYLGRFCSGRPCLPRDFTSLISDLLPGLGRPSVGTLGEEVEPPLPDFPARLGRAWVVGDVAELRLGARRYELSDWLGNVRVVVTDRRLPIRGNNQVVVGYRAEVVSVTDYYSFGAEISMRSYEAQPWYRYGYQAQEKDNEIYGKGAMYYYKYRQHDARLGRFWSVDPLARKYPWNSPYAFAENDVVNSVELEGLERVEARIHTSLTLGGDSRLRGLGYWNVAVGLDVGIPLGKEAELMMGLQHVTRGYAGGLGGLGQDEKMRVQGVTSTVWVLGTGDAPEMELHVFHSRMPSLFNVSYKFAFMVSSNYVMDKGWSQRVMALGVRAGDFMVSTYNDFFVGLIQKLVYRTLRLEPPPAPDEYDTGGGQVSALLRGWPGGIRTIDAGTEVFTSLRMIVFNGTTFKELIDQEENGRKYYRVYRPEQNIGWWYLRLNGEWSHGYWTVGGYLLGGEPGMAFQNWIHDLIKNPRYKSLHRSGLGFMGGLEQTARTGP